MIKVIKSGLYSSIQDLGRFGKRDSGVPVSGAMDLFSAELANSLLNNPKGSAILEMTMVGAEFHFLVNTQIVISGANISPKINGQSIPNNKVYNISANDILSFGKLITGLRCYLAVKGGFKAKMVYGSRSFFKPITLQDVINVGDLLLIDVFSKFTNTSNSCLKLNAANFSSEIIEVFKGVEFNLLSKSQQKQLFETKFQVSNLYNRMAYQLKPLFKNNLKSILTGPVLPGTVQLTPSGKLIILMRDCQTTGGYPRVLQLTKAAINLLSQKKQSDIIKFKLVNL